MNNKHLLFCLVFFQAIVVCMNQKNTVVQLEVPKYSTSIRRLSEGKKETKPILTASAEIRMKQSPKTPNQGISPLDYLRWASGSPIETRDVSSQ